MYCSSAYLTFLFSNVFVSRPCDIATAQTTSGLNLTCLNSYTLTYTYTNLNSVQHGKQGKLPGGILYQESQVPKKPRPLAFITMGILSPIPPIGGAQLVHVSRGPGSPPTLTQLTVQQTCILVYQPKSSAERGVSRGMCISLMMEQVVPPLSDSDGGLSSELSTW